MIGRETPCDIVAIVPARSGNKRLPKKNALPLAGKPLIQWTLDAAKASGIIDLTVVSTDDKILLDIADQNQVKTIQRPRDHQTAWGNAAKVKRRN